MEALLINTSRLIIRPFVDEDVEGFFDYRSNPEVTQYQSFDVMTRAEAAAFITRQKDKQFGELGQWMQFAIAFPATNEIIGDCGIVLQAGDSSTAEVGITLSPRQQKQGFAKEAMLGVLQFLFEVKQVRRIVETVDAENTASINLLQKVGFRQEGYFVETIFFKGKWGSEYQFALLKREWDGLKNSRG